MFKGVVELLELLGVVCNGGMEPWTVLCRPGASLKMRARFFLPGSCKGSGKAEISSYHRVAPAFN